MIGGGFVGCAGAVALAGRGAEVTLFEAAAVLGGRARRVERDGLALDNGQHLMLGAYRETRALVERVGGPRLRRAACCRPSASPHGSAMRARDWPAPFGLLAGIATARGLTPGERFATLRWFAGLRARGFRCAPGATVAELTAPLPPRVAAALWHPLCLAALNTLPQEASAQLFANVIAGAFDGARHDADAIGYAGDLSALLPEPCARFLEVRGQRLRLRTQASPRLRRPASRWRRGARRPMRARHSTGRSSPSARTSSHRRSTRPGPPASPARRRRSTPCTRSPGSPSPPYISATTSPPRRSGCRRGCCGSTTRRGSAAFARDDIVARAGPSRKRRPRGGDLGARPARRVPGALPRALLAVVISARGPHDALLQVTRSIAPRTARHRSRGASGGAGPRPSASR